MGRHTARHKSRLSASARLVRICVLSFVVSLGPAYVALSEFDRQYGVPRTVVTTGACDGDACRSPYGSRAAADLVAALEDDGHACSTTPELTDVVVVEGTAGRVAVVPFDVAVRVSTERTAWVRAYCSAP